MTVVLGLAAPAIAQETDRPALALPPLGELMGKLVTDRPSEFEFTRYHLHRHGAEALEPLRAALASESVKQRSRAASVLEAIGPAAGPALPDLVTALKWEPETGREGGPGEFAGLRAAAYRLCARLGYKPAMAVAKSQLNAVMRDLGKVKGQSEKEQQAAKQGAVPDWVPAAVGCWLELGGKSARRALTKQLSGVVTWTDVSPGPLLTAVGRSRHPECVAVLAAVAEVADVEIRAIQARNDQRIARAARSEKSPEGLETPGPAKPMALAALRAAASPAGEDTMRNGGAWRAWYDAHAKYLYYSVTDNELRVDAAARDAGQPTAQYRTATPWTDRDGPYPPLEMPAFAGGIPRLRPGEQPMDLPGEGHKDD